MLKSKFRALSSRDMIRLVIESPLAAVYRMDWRRLQPEDKRLTELPRWKIMAVQSAERREDEFERELGGRVSWDLAVRIPSRREKSYRRVLSFLLGHYQDCQERDTHNLDFHSVKEAGFFCVNALSSAKEFVLSPVAIVNSWFILELWQFGHFSYSKRRIIFALNLDTVF